MINQDKRVIEGFGDEWSEYPQEALSPAELQHLFQLYFEIFPWDKLPQGAVGFDLGCGSGRWAKFVSQKVGKVHCIDPSQKALEVAKRNLQDRNNCEFHMAGVDAIPLPDNSMDFGYSLGVLHHVPDTAKGIFSCCAKLKKGSPFLVYLYYALENRPIWFRLAWNISEFVRFFVSRTPFPIRLFLSKLIAFFLYLPFALISRFCERIGIDVDNFPLSFYRNKSFYTMSTDALDRFGTRLEQRFTQHQIQEMMVKAGLQDIRFNSKHPMWCAVGLKG